jgi:hypothetical protein
VLHHITPAVNATELLLLLLAESVFLSAIGLRL